MLPNHSSAPRGHMHHRRGFVVTRNGTRDVAYILNLTDSNSGHKLVIETLTRDNNGEFIPSTLLSPILPYRIPVADSKTWTVLNTGNGWESQASGSYAIFNPGTTLTGNKMDPPCGFGLGSAQGSIQLNITRDQIERLNRDKDSVKVWNVFRSTTTVGPTYDNSGGLVSNFKYEANDRRASILAVNDGTTDYLYISVSTNVVMTGKEGTSAFYFSDVDNKNAVSTGTAATYSYTVPILVKLAINRSQLSPMTYRDVLPVAWRYLFPLKSVPGTWSKAINSDAISEFTTNSWNCDIIPRRVITGSRGYAIPSTNITWTVNETIYVPVGYGCMWDTVLDTTNSRLVSMSAIGEIDPNTNRKIQNINWQVHTLADLTSNVFAKEYTGRSTGSNPETVSISRIYGEENQGHVLFAVSVNHITATEHAGSIGLYYFDNLLNGRHMAISSCWSACVAKSGSSFVIACDRTSTTEFGSTILKCPPFALMSAWKGEARDITSLTAKNNSFGFTYLGHAAIWPTFEKDTFEHVGYSSTSLPTYYYNVFGEDKSPLNTPFWVEARFIRELYNSTIELTTIERYIISKTTLHTHVHTHVYHNQNSNWIFYNYRNDGGGPIPALSIPLGIASLGDNGTDSLDYFRFYVVEDNLVKIQCFDTQVLNINGTASMGYWANPTFDVDSQGHKGVFVIFILSNCSGIFRKGTGEIGDWDDTGVPINPIYTRPDVMYDLGGNYESYVNSGGSGNYWATINSPTWKLSLNYNGNELVLDDWKCSFTDYTIDGLTNIHVHTYLDFTDNDGNQILDGEGRPYTDAAFALSGVVYKLNIHTPDLVVAEGTVDIEPPAPDASITTSVVYKTIASSFDYSVSRSEDTSINNIIRVKNGKRQEDLGYYSLTDPTSGTITVSTNDMIKGDWKAVQYRPLYQGSRGSDQESRRITYVGGHKYHLENVEIWIDGYDKTSDITESSDPWLYIKTTGNISVGIVADIKHEDFGDREAYSNLGLVYPMINKTYMMVVPRSSIPRSSSSFVKGVPLLTVYEEVPPVGSPLAYPNCGYIMANRLQQRWDSTAALNKASGVYGSIIEKDGESLTAAVGTDGEYHIFLIVEDEFSQRSVWCITNPKNNFRIPFAGI